MHWGGEADLLLFKYLLKTHDVKVDYKVLAEAMGNGITPKAITHRIAKIRSLAPISDEADAITPNATPTKAGNTPRASKAKAAKGKKRGAAAIEDSELSGPVDQDDESGSQKSMPKKIKLGEKLSSSDEQDDKDNEGDMTVQVAI